MTIIKGNDCIVNGYEIPGGGVFVPLNSKTSYASCHRGRVGCGVTYEVGSRAPWLRFSPGIRVPQALREGFERWACEHDNDRYMDVRLDAKDGEIYMLGVIERVDLDTVKAAIESGLDFIVNELYPELLEWFASK